MARKLHHLFIAAFATLVIGCGESQPNAQVTTASSSPSPPHSYPYKAVATVGMVTDIVRHVAGERAEVSGIIGEGVDPHLYKATSADVTELLGADIVFYSGLMLEGKMADALVRVGRNKPVYAVTEEIDPTFLLEPPEFEGHHDPHVWMDVHGWMAAVDAIAKSLSEFDPANAAEYEANAKGYNEQLKLLDEYARSSIASIPETGRVLITAHDAFNYFGRAYGIEVMGVQGLSTESEASIRDIEDLVEEIVIRDIKAVFVESSVSSKNIKALQEGAKVRGHELRIGGELFSDAMGAPGTYEGTYIGMLDHNVTIIARGLGGTAPEKGLNGKLSGTHQ
jgi:manganese/zinc/iron transport system substrate-binding protein